MDIKQATNARRECEKEIARIVQEFMDATGLQVVSLELRTIEPCNLQPEEVRRYWIEQCYLEVRL